jgi:fibronectin-binding autotransporter adhesin
VTGTVPTNRLDQMVIYAPTEVDLVLGVVRPTNATIYSALTTTLVQNGQNANGMVLDRLGTRLAGVADGLMVARPQGPSGNQLAQGGGGNLAALTDIAQSLPPALAEAGVWMRGIGSFASLDRNGAAPGFDADRGGFLVGFDRPVGEWFGLPGNIIYAGLAAGYIHSDVTEHQPASGDADTGRVMAYAGTWAGPTLVTGTVGYAHDSIHTVRNFAGIGSARENHGGDEATAALQWSAPMTVPTSWGLATVTPRIGAQFLHLHEGGFSDSGAGGLDLSSGGRNTDSFQPYLGVALSESFVCMDGIKFTPEVRAGYSREVLSNNRLVTVAAIDGTPFVINGVKPSRDMLTAGVGITAQARDNLSLYANYDALTHTGNTLDQTVSVGLRIRF